VEERAPWASFQIRTSSTMTSFEGVERNLKWNGCSAERHGMKWVGVSPPQSGLIPFVQPQKRGWM